MSKRFLIATLRGMLCGGMLWLGLAHAQVARLASDTSVKVTPEAFAHAKALVVNSADAQQLWRAVNTINDDSAVDAALKQRANQWIDEAEKLGNVGSNGQSYRLLMQGLTSLAGLPWTAKEQFKAALMLNLQTLVADQVNPLLITLTQRFPAEYSSAQILRMQTSLVAAPAPGVNPLDGTPGGAATTAAFKPKTFWTNEITSKDLVADPVTYEVDISDVPEGRYLIKAEILDGTQSLGAVSAPVIIVRDLVGRAAKVEQKLMGVQGHDSAKASARFPFNLARAINGWRRQTVDNIALVSALKDSEILADQLAKGNDPLYQARGDHKRHYWLAEAGETLPYRIYVPAAWDGKKKLPMVVNLHGGGGNEDNDFNDTRPGITAKFSDLAEQYGMIVVVPSAYRPNGGYGTSYGLTPAGRPSVWPSSPAKTVTELSEMDIIKVMDLVTQEYNVDRSRTYLVGNSMGGGGVWHIGSKYAERFAAIAPCASSMDLRDMPTFPFDRLKSVPTIAAVGEFDIDLRKAVARYGIAELKKRGYTATLIEVKGGNHGNAWRMVLPDIFKFFSQYQKAG